jgi:RNA polymerase sigma factor (TIGR02999 family)
VRLASSCPVTDLLSRWSKGDATARDALVPLVYEELRRVARKCLGARRGDHALQSTALVHEAYLHLVDHGAKRWENRVHFFAVAAQIMRRILVDQARMRAAAKRGGETLTLVLDEEVAPPRAREVDLVALDDALNSLAALNSRQCNIVELRFFGGLSIEETAQVLGISPATVKRNWALARIWLSHEVSKAART